jgi:hypothetical protein
MYVKWIKVAQDKAQWRALANMAASMKDGKFAERIPASEEGLSLELQNNCNDDNDSSSNNINNNNLPYQGNSELINTVSFRCTFSKMECKFFYPTALLSGLKHAANSTFRLP